MAYVHFKNKWPSCTEPTVYRLWKEATTRAIPQYGFCTDCTPEYQSKMIRAGRCEHPEVLFEIDKDGFICGTIRKTLK